MFTPGQQEDALALEPLSNEHPPALKDPSQEK